MAKQIAPLLLLVIVFGASAAGLSPSPESPKARSSTMDLVAAESYFALEDQRRATVTDEVPTIPMPHSGGAPVPDGTVDNTGRSPSQSALVRDEAPPPEFLSSIKI